jgi:hypothetical protein
MARLSKREQDAIVMELTDVDGGADPDDPQWQSEFDRLDPEHQMDLMPRLGSSRITLSATRTGTRTRRAVPQIFSLQGGRSTAVLATTA